jgi:hypothetical protein
LSDVTVNARRERFGECVIEAGVPRQPEFRAAVTGLRAVAADSRQAVSA